MSIIIRRKYPDDPASRYWLFLNGEPVLDCPDFTTALQYIFDAGASQILRGTTGR